MNRAKGIVIGFWIVTALFCLQIGFTAYAQLALPQVADAFAHLGFPDYFRVQLAWANLLGIVAAARAGAGAAQGMGLCRLSPSTSLRDHRLTSRSAMVRTRGAGQSAPVCSGGCRTSSGAVSMRRRLVAG